MSNSLLQIENLSYRYPNGHVAVSDLSLNLGPGILGLLGPNGAGKSSLMRVLATLSKASAGRVMWKGQDIAMNPDALRVELGYLPQDFGVYPALSAREFLGFLAAVKGLSRKQSNERVQQCLVQVGLAEAAEKPLGSFSGGMRQRVGIAQALLNDPQLLIVDEPTVGLDPEERLRFRHLLTDLADHRLVILSTHIVSDVEASATAIAVMAEGRLRFHGTPEAMLASAVGMVWELTIASEQLSAMREHLHICHSVRRPEGVRIRVIAASAPRHDAEAVTPSLEDAYMALSDHA
ncbi:MAG TPA: ABC transporter ATP-binding protein [Burkholderiaceae bacterium]|jgi:ABC-2 type transport system ATP-binding protein